MNKILWSIIIFSLWPFCEEVKAAPQEVTSPPPQTAISPKTQDTPIESSVIKVQPNSAQWMAIKANVTRRLAAGTTRNYSGRNPIDSSSGTNGTFIADYLGKGEGYPKRIFGDPFMSVRSSRADLLSYDKFRWAETQNTNYFITYFNQKHTIVAVRYSMGQQLVNEDMIKWFAAACGQDGDWDWKWEQTASFCNPINDKTGSGMLFSFNNVSDINSFVNQLAMKTNPLSAFLYEHLSNDGRCVVDRKLIPYVESKVYPNIVRKEGNTWWLYDKRLGQTYGIKIPSANDEVKRLNTPINREIALLEDIANIIQTKTIYDSTRFGNIRLRNETLQLLTSNPSGDELQRLNRLLLEDAYPTAIRRQSSFLKIGDKTILQMKEMQRHDGKVAVAIDDSCKSMYAFLAVPVDSDTDLANAAEMERERAVSINRGKEQLRQEQQATQDRATYLKQRYGGFYGAYKTKQDAMNAATRLNANQQGTTDAMREMTIGGGAAIGNFQVRTYRVHFDEDTGLWVVY